MVFTVDWAQVIDWTFQLILLPGLYLGIRTLGRMKDSIDDLKETVVKLVTNHDNHEKRIDKLEQKIWED